MEKMKLLEFEEMKFEEICPVCGECVLEKFTDNRVWCRKCFYSKVIK